jgi:hypothetical protein
MNRICTKCGGKETDGVLFYGKKRECKPCNILRSKNYQRANKEKINSQHKEYRRKNREKVLLKRREHSAKNAAHISARAKDYYERNKEHLRTYSKVYRKNRLKTNHIYRLRENISSAIRKGLQYVGASKAGDSCYKYLSYSSKELKKHLEKQFEPWMNWDNHGVYRIETWNDDDSSTWTWQIDHIVPHSNFTYTSMEDQAFKDCWALSNLRPLSAKENLSKGNR